MKHFYRLLPFAIVVLLLHSSSLFAQQNYTLSGYVKDSANGETFISATIVVKEIPNTGTYTNAFGFYSITIPKGNYTIAVSYLGYQTIEKNIVLDKNVATNFELKSSITTFQKDIVIKTERKDEGVKNTQMGQIELSTEKIKTLPAIFGEVDVMKTLQLLPGVLSAGEGQTGFYVRGGGPDQNLILLDDAVVYNTGHLLGFFSVFNSDAIKNTTLIKGGMPANYGGRLSSVVDVTMKEGNNKTYHATGGIGLIASRLTLEGPIQKGKSSFMIAGRRTYIDVLTAPIINNYEKAKSLRGSGYYFYDFNAKANYRLSHADRLYLSGYFGRDVFSFKSPSGTFKFSMPWGNQTASLRWNHLFSEKLFVNTSVIYNAYQFDINIGQGQFSLDLNSKIRDWNFKSDFDYYLNTTNKIKFGVNYIYHFFSPSAITAKFGDLEIKPDERFKKYAHEGALYAMDDWDVSKKIKINYGLRYVLYQQVGPYNEVRFDANHNPIDTVFYNKGDLVKHYGGLKNLEPRVTARYELNSVSSIKASYSHNNQFIHLVSNNGTTLPTDIWVPSTSYVNPQISDQWALGYFRNFKDNTYETSVEVYYKQMKNQIEYREFYVPNAQTDVEKDFIFGTGEAYGAEFFINKQYGKLTGWLGYTLAFTNRNFPGLNNGKTYPAKFDRRHDANVVIGYTLNEHWKFGGTWTYASGNVVTVPIGLYTIDGTLVEQFANLNSFRLPAYHRADVSATWTPKHKKKKKVEGSWTFSVYNVYGRFNPYIVYLDTQGSVNAGTATVSARQVSLFPKPLPSVTWNFKF